MPWVPVAGTNRLLFVAMEAGYLKRYFFLRDGTDSAAEWVGDRGHGYF